MNYSRAKELQEAYELRLLEMQNKEEERRSRILAERAMIKAEKEERSRIKQMKIEEARRKKEETLEAKRKELEMKLLEKDYQKMLYVQRIKDLRESMRLQAAEVLCGCKSHFRSEGKDWKRRGSENMKWR